VINEHYESFFDDASTCKFNFKRSPKVIPSRYVYIMISTVVQCHSSGTEVLVVI
jgi:hypothetical protein